MQLIFYNFCACPTATAPKYPALALSLSLTPSLSLTHTHQECLVGNIAVLIDNVSLREGQLSQPNRHLSRQAERLLLCGKPDGQ